MSCDGVVLYTPWGDEICIPMYYELKRWPWDDPGPWVHFVNEQGDPDWFVDLGALNGIAQVASGIQDSALKQQMTAVISEAIAGISSKLPEGVRIGENFGVNQVSG